MKKVIQKEIHSFLLKNNIDILPEVMETTNSEFGDFSSNILFKLIKDNNDVANELVLHLQSKKDIFELVEVKNKGFLNFKLNHLFVIKFIQNSLKHYDFNTKKENINFEFISANPTGYLHIGHARNAIVGDVVIKLLESIGNKVYREFYVNDAGNQINDLVNSIKINIGILDGELPYKGIDVKLASETFKSINANYKNASDSEIKEFAINYFLDEIKRIIIAMNIKPFNKFSSERDLYKQKQDHEILNKLLKSDNAYENEGAIWLDTPKKGDDKARVLKKSTGENTYFLMDIVYHFQKASQGFDKLIDLWGTDHKGHEKKLFIALDMLGLKQNLTEVAFINMVQVMDGDEVMKMSKRLGTSLSIKEMLTKIDVNQLRYFLLSKKKETEIDIDINFVNTKNNANPYFYNQYTYVRAKNIISKAKEQGIEPTNHFELIGKDKHERELMVHLSKLWDHILHAANEREPNTIIEYLKNLSSFFHSFYNYCVVISDDKKISQERVSLVNIVITILDKIYDILGITPMEKM